LRRRAAKAGLKDRPDLRPVPPDNLGVDDLAGRVDLVFAFAVVHELPAVALFFAAAAAVLKPGATLFLAEPADHVTAAECDEELKAAATAGLAITARRTLANRRVAVLAKSV
jgi:SAM-dependent methyltransferase